MTRGEQNSTGIEEGLIPLLIFTSSEELTSFAETLIAIHDDIVSQAGYAPDVDDRQRTQMQGRLESILSSVFLEHFGQMPEYDDIFVQVSVFAEYCAKDHIFHDGNKRTALKGSLAILRINGVELDVPDPDDAQENQIYQWIQDIVNGNCSTIELANFLRTHAHYVAVNLFSQPHTLSSHDGEETNP